METIYHFYKWADPFFIAAYRLFENPFLGFLAGTAFIALICIIAGEMMMRIALLFAGNYTDAFYQKAVRMHNLSIRAILRKDRESYRACNKVANDAFGRYFFAQAALGASALWAAPFALGWMATRFEDVEFPLAGVSMHGLKIGYAGMFILIYVLIRIGFGEFKRRFPGLMISAPKRGLSDSERMITWRDVEKLGGYPGRAPSSGKPAGEFG